jgi:TonB family protein
MSLRIAVLLGTGAMAAAGAAFAQTSPMWAEAPSVADIAAAYPAKAKAAGVRGEVNLTCEINRQGRPHDCAALGETPSGYGFGFAARRLAEQMRVGDPGMNGKEVRVPVTFDPAVLKGAPTVTKPSWAALPSAADFQASFPKAENGINKVRVVLACTVAPGGALAGCAVDQEEPAGQGFGEGALALASKFRVGPWSLDGKPTVGAKLRVPIRYELTPVKQAVAPAKP